MFVVDYNIFANLLDYSNAITFFSLKKLYFLLILVRKMQNGCLFFVKNANFY